MPRDSKFKDGGSVRGGRHYLAPAIDPWAADADTDGIENWDSRPDEIAEAILGFLARGQAIMIGVSTDGGTVSIGINTGPKKWSRQYARDGGEWIGIWHHLVRTLRMAKLPETPGSE